MVKNKKTKKVSKMSLRKRADAIFSKFIRQRDRDKNTGEGICYTCGRRDSWRKLQCGHFVPRQYLMTRFSEVNCNSQCFACNMLYNGQPSAYAKRLNKEYGAGTTDMLESKRLLVVPDFDYQYIIDIYTEKCRALGFET